jgi:type IV pilus assembly protein PilX
MLSVQYGSLRARVGHAALPHRQSGVVLMIALIILVVMTMGGIALVRTVDTTNLIAGNLAFQQAATRSGDRATEEAVRTFLEVNTPETFWNHVPASGYRANVENPAAGQTWDQFWKATLNPTAVSLPVAAKTCVDRVCILPLDFSGNTVSYTIQRLCQTAGDPLSLPTGCANAPEQTAPKGKSQGSGTVPLPEPVKYYYRITARVAGPRNTSSYVQTIVAK